jgi:hypothetical protein
LSVSVKVWHAEDDRKCADARNPIDVQSMSRAAE